MLPGLKMENKKNHPKIVLTFKDMVFKTLSQF